MKRTIIAAVEMLGIREDQCLIRVLCEGQWETRTMNVGERFNIHSITVEPAELVAVIDEYEQAIVKAKSAQ